jgi:site-specific recombinase XerD
MGPPRYGELLRTNLESLNPKVKGVRLGIADYFDGVTPAAKRELVWRFRHLARYWRIKPNLWPKVADRLFSMKPQAAESEVARYRSWISARKFSWRTELGLSCLGFRRLSRTLRAKGLLDWEFRHSRTIATQERINRCPADYRMQVDEYLRVLRTRMLRPSTIKSQVYELVVFGLYLSQRKVSFKHLSYSDALTWLERVREEGLVRTGFNRRLQVVKKFYEWLKNRGEIALSPFATFEAVRITRTIPKVLTESEVKRLINASSKGRDRAVLEVLYASGCRISEVCGLDLERLCFEERTARVITKGGHEGIIYLNESALKAIKAYLPERKRILKEWCLSVQPALFVCRGGGRLNSYSARAAVKRASKIANLGKHVHPHMIRYSFATHMLNRGADLYSIMQFLGHKEIQSTVRYLQAATKRLSDVHKKFHPRR